MRLLFLLWLVLHSAGCSQSPSAPERAWTTGARLEGAIFRHLNSQPVLAVGGSWSHQRNGVVALRVSDTDWKPHIPSVEVESQPFLLNDVSFVDSQQGWACGSRGAVLQTSDGGKSWTQVRQGRVPEHLAGIKFLDQRRGFVAFYQGLIATNDAGRSWSPVARGDLCDVAFSDERNGWAVGQHPAVFVTSDGGASWRPATLPGFRVYDRLVSVKFLDQKHGAIVGYNGGRQLSQDEPGDGAILYVTEDGGLNWKRRGEGLMVQLNDVWFESPEHGFAGGERQGAGGGVVLETRDRGETWSPLELTLQGVPTGLEGGWLCTDKGELLQWR